MSVDNWELACSAVQDVIAKWEMKVKTTKKTLSLPFYYFLSTFREKSTVLLDNIDTTPNDATTCPICRILNVFVETLVVEPDEKTLSAFVDAVNCFLMEDGNSVLPRCCLSFSDEQSAVFCSLYLQCWLETLPHLELPVDFLSFDIHQFLDSLIGANSLGVSSFASSLIITLHELAFLFVHKCSLRDADMIQKLVSDIAVYCVSEFCHHFFTVSDSHLFRNWCNSQFSELILQRNKENDAYVTKPLCSEVAIYDEVILRRAGWFWNNDVDFNEGKTLLAMFPEGAFMVLTNDDLYKVSEKVEAVLLVKTKKIIDEYAVRRTVTSGVSFWSTADSEKTCHFLIDLVHWLFTSKLQNCCDLLFPASKWVHDRLIFTSMSPTALKKLMLDVEMKQSKLNQGLETAQADFATEQAAIQTARNNTTLRSLSQLVKMYEQQKTRLTETQKQNASSATDLAKIDSTFALLESRLKSLSEQKTALENKLLKANTQRFSNLQSAYRVRLQASSLDAIKLRTVVDSHDVASQDEAYGEDLDSSDDASWMAPEGLNREEAEQLLSTSPEGSFLVRSRVASAWLQTQERRPYAISFRWNGQTHHIVVYRIMDVEKGTGGFSLVAYQSAQDAENSGNLFSSLPELINHYRNNQLPIDNKDSPGFGAKLIHPLCSH